MIFFFSVFFSFFFFLPGNILKAASVDVDRVLSLALARRIENQEKPIKGGEITGDLAGTVTGEMVEKTCGLRGE